MYPKFFKNRPPPKLSLKPEFHTLATVELANFNLLELWGNEIPYQLNPNPKTNRNPKPNPHDLITDPNPKANHIPSSNHNEYVRIF